MIVDVFYQYTRKLKGQSKQDTPPLIIHFTLSSRYASSHTYGRWIFLAPASCIQVFLQSD